jgi:hypothetical protein
MGGGRGAAASSRAGGRVNRLHAQASSSAPTTPERLLFERLGRLREQLTDVEFAAADVDDGEIDRYVHEARQAIEQAGNRAAVRARSSS